MENAFIYDCYNVFKHEERVRGIVSKIADELQMVDEKIILMEAASVHDIGKDFISPNVLFRRGGLSKAEWYVISKHIEIGYLRLKELGFDEVICQLCYFHHGMYNDKYSYDLDITPLPIVKELYPVLMAADIYDAVTSPRVYHRSISGDTALSILRGNSEIPSFVIDAMSVLNTI